MLSEGNLSPTRIISQYIKSLLKIDKLKASIASKITYIITILDNNIKSAVYTGANIHGIYRYLEIIVASTTLTTSDQLYHHSGPSSSTNNYTGTIQIVVAYLCIQHKNICKLFERI